MLRVVEHLGGWTVFYDSAAVEEDDQVGCFPGSPSRE
jgi:hypothetical protein